MTRISVLVLAVWLLVGVFAAFQRGDFDDGNCSTVTDTALVVILGPISYTAPDTLDGTCIEHNSLAEALLAESSTIWSWTSSPGR